ncbi:hypothetical protein LCGC14_0625510 [marine sediment metagenome]|uniref:Cupin type-2 domain-containing protein n=1 Tax=marine sediment metagenome TaxID=412755 RepID=A0A0F9TPZ4_9ZZZZ|nr:MAG: Cupin domain protein [Candidatus Lokiarchaeum sp. GC14_75]
MTKKVINKKDIQSTETIKGVYRRTMVFNENIMLCHFTLEKDAEIPLHHHRESQVEYILHGRIKFFTEDRELIVKKGDSYIFEPDERHGATILENSEVIDIFNPARVDYR